MCDQNRDCHLETAFLAGRVSKKRRGMSSALRRDNIMLCARAITPHSAPAVMDEAHHPAFDVSERVLMIMRGGNALPSGK